MNFTFCDIVQHTLVILEFLSNIRCQAQPVPWIVASKCQANISNEFGSHFYKMVSIMKENINPQVSKQIYQFIQQPDYNYISYFKYDIEFMARFVLSKIEKAFEEVNYDQFFNQVTDCSVCDHHNRTTSRTCLKDKKFKEAFINSSIQLFNEYPLAIERKKYQIIDEFKKKKNVSTFTNLYGRFLEMFNETRYIELEMQNMIKDRFSDCCSRDESIGVKVGNKTSISKIRSNKMLN